MEYALMNHYKRFITKIKPIYQLSNLVSILDVGCGDGTWEFEIFSRHSKFTIGADIKISKNWKNIKSQNVYFIRCDACNLPFKPKLFDVVFAKDLLHHASNHMKTLDEIFNVCKGTIIIIEANRYEPVSYVHMTKFRGHNHFSFKKFEEMILSKTNIVHFVKIENHYLPTNSKLPVRLFFILQDIKEKIFPLNRLLNYNIAIVTIN